MEDRTSLTKNLVGMAGVHEGGDSEQEQRRSRIDTPASRFERLRSLALADVASTGWIDINDVEHDFGEVRTGSLIELECEIYVPEVIKALSPSGGLHDALAFVERLAPQAEVMGLDLTNMPSKPQTEAMKSISGLLGSDVVVVGERDDTDWRVVGRLMDSFVQGEIEGIARVIGKVTTSWKQGHWKPLMALPGMNILPREQRRQMERMQPKAGQEQNHLEGPAFMLDVLAIYR